MGILLALIVSILFVVSPSAVARSHAGQSAESMADKLNNTGVDLYSAGRYQQAIEEYTKAISVRPHYAEAYSNRGASYDALNEHEQALKDYTTAIELKPSFIGAYSNRAETLAELGRFSEAISDWNVVIKKRPRSAASYMSRGKCLKKVGDLQAALSDFKQALKLSPHDSKAMAAANEVKQALNSGTALDSGSGTSSDLTSATAALPAPAVTPPAPHSGAAAISGTRPSINPSAPPSFGSPRPAASTQGNSSSLTSLSDSPTSMPLSSSPTSTPLSSSPSSASSAVSTSSTSSAANPSAGPSVPAGESPRSEATLPASSLSNRFPAPSAVSLCFDAMHQFLGGIYLAFGQYQSAATQYNQASLDNPADAFAHFRCGNVYSLQGDEHAALREYEAAVTLSPHFRQAYMRREQLKRTIVVPTSGEATDNHTPQ